MNLVQIAYNAIQSFNLSDNDRLQLVDLLQGNEIKERAKQKLKVQTKAQIEKEQMTNWLKKHHFKSQNGKNLH